MDEVTIYISKFPNDKQIILNKIIYLLNSSFPNLSASMSYGVPTFKLNNKLILHFAIFKNHLGIFPSPKTVDKFKDRLSIKQISKGTIRFPFDKEIPYDFIKEIIDYNLKN